MRTLKVNTGFKIKKDAEILQYALTVMAAMTDNVNFPTPAPALGEVQTAVDDYQEKLAKASQKGSPLDISIKNESKQALAKILKNLALYVNSVGEDNLSVLLSSGFPLSAQPIKGLAPEIPTQLRMKDGPLSGQIRFDFGSVDRAMLYEYCYASERDANGDLDWSDRLTTSSSVNNILSPVKPSLTYYIKVRAVNRNGVGDWCEPVSLIAR
ncbi:hypothetical protein GCM10023231_35210 [Olivibacter ginsenosidimutans]|uniref:Fibronectin type-III domain-containing protein n=1 Tax=Olivibacter ginsenosidimutans TaxID=1176537 RepID=A0ABP9C5F5_9SPHI